MFGSRESNIEHAQQRFCVLLKQVAPLNRLPSQVRKDDPQAAGRLVWHNKLLAHVSQDSDATGLQHHSA